MSATKHEGAPLPEDENDRIKFLRSLNILDTVAEDAFDDITRLLAMIFDVPIALVVLVDGERQWFKSSFGFAEKERPRDESFCAHVLLPYTPEILLVPDAAQDSRFCNNPLVVGEPYIRFYCGAPIILQRHRLGALCIVDKVPKLVGKQEAMLLANFADLVASSIDKERQVIANHDMRDNPSFLINVSEESWPVLYMNDLGRNLLNPSRGSMPSFMNHFSFDQLDRDVPLYETHVLRGRFGFKDFCTCTLYPATRQAFGSDPQQRIGFPYTDLSQSGPAHLPTALPNTIAVGADAGRCRCFFVVVKLDRDEPAPPEPAGPRVKPWFPMPRQMSFLETAEAFTAATQEPRCVVMFNSRFCGSCSRFTEYYTMLCNSFSDGVRFCVVSIDDATGITAMLGKGAMFLPMVHFYSRGVMIDEMAGSGCAEFRQRLKAFAKGEKPALSAPSRPAVSAPMTSHPSTASSASATIVPGRPAEAAPAPEGQNKLQRAVSYFAKKVNICMYRGVHGSETRPASTSSSSSSPTPNGKRLAGGTGSAGDSVAIPHAKRALHKQLSGDLELNAKAGTPYRFAGSVLSCLSPVSTHRRVLIYGGQLADRLGDDMASVGIDAQRQECLWPSKELVAAASGSKQPVVVVNINDFWSPGDIHTSFVEVAKALSAADVLVVLSSENRFLDVLSLLGASSGWASKCTKGSEREYWIVVFQRTDADACGGERADARGGCSSCVFRPGQPVASEGELV